MIKNSLFKDLSANAIQTAITQMAGLVVFYIMSKYLPKSDFGAYSWATAVGATIITIGSFGLDLVLVKRIAAGQDAHLFAGLHLFHTTLVGIFILLVILLLQYFFPNIFSSRPFFILVLLQLIFVSIANSIRFSLQGLEAFKSLAIIALIVNILKMLVVVLLFVFSYLSISYIIFGFIICAIIELLLNYYFVNRVLASVLKPRFHKISYYGFIKESLPQLGVVLFDSALARVDWIILGLVSTATVTAEYSFVYKFFELSKMPLLIIAPVLLTRFSKIFQNEEAWTQEKRASIQKFFNLELFVAMLIPIVMICAWTDLIDWVTNGKYGAVNQLTYTILAFCVPLHYIINFLWTLGFVQAQLKEIMWITIFSSLINVILNVCFIPFWKGDGAALAFLGSSIMQLVLYYKYIRRSKLNTSFFPILAMVIVTFIITLALRSFLGNAYLSISLVLLLYFATGIITKQFSFKKSI